MHNENPNVVILNFKYLGTITTFFYWKYTKNKNITYC